MCCIFTTVLKNQFILCAASRQGLGLIQITNDYITDHNKLTLVSRPILREFLKCNSYYYTAYLSYQHCHICINTYILWLSQYRQAYLGFITFHQLRFVPGVKQPIQNINQPTIKIKYKKLNLFHKIVKFYSRPQVKIFSWRRRQFQNGFWRFYDF